MGTPSWNPPAETVTHPDPIAPAALAFLEFLGGESILRCWKTGLGFLVMTNLRVVEVWRKPELLADSHWHTGPSYFFYDLASPRVVASRFVELTEEADPTLQGSRFLVRDPGAVRDEIDAARPAGRAEWERRRATARAAAASRRAAPPMPPPTVVREIVREVVKVRCRYCGNLMEEAADRCPFCGAPQT